MTTGRMSVKSRKFLMDHRLEAGATLFKRLIVRTVATDRREGRSCNHSSSLGLRRCSKGPPPCGPDYGCGCSAELLRCRQRVAEPGQGVIRQPAQTTPVQRGDDVVDAISVDVHDDDRVD